jgi:hypothetical protein
MKPRGRKKCRQIQPRLRYCVVSHKARDNKRDASHLRSSVPVAFHPSAGDISAVIRGFSWLHFPKPQSRVITSRNQGVPIGQIRK